MDRYQHQDNQSSSKETAEQVEIANPSSSPGHVPREGVSDAELAAAACAGDESAFELLFERHRRRVGAIAGRFFQQPEQIEEMVQECFTKAYFALDDVAHYREDSFAAWLARIAFNCCYDELRRQGRSKERTISDITDVEAQTLRSLHAGCPGIAGVHRHQPRPGKQTVEPAERGGSAGTCLTGRRRTLRC